VYNTSLLGNYAGRALPQGVTALDSTQRQMYLIISQVGVLVQGSFDSVSPKEPVQEQRLTNVISLENCKQQALSFLFFLSDFGQI